MSHVRCRHCAGRRTLNRHPDSYTRLPRCLRCGKPGNYRVDKHRATRETGKHAPRPCRCTGYSFPHFLGRGWCDHNARLTADDLRERAESGRRYA